MSRCEYSVRVLLVAEIILQCSTRFVVGSEIVEFVVDSKLTTLKIENKVQGTMVAARMFGVLR